MQERSLVLIGLGAMPMYSAAYQNPQKKNSRRVYRVYFHLCQLQRPNGSSTELHLNRRLTKGEKSRWKTRNLTRKESQYTQKQGRIRLANGERLEEITDHPALRLLANRQRNRPPHLPTKGNRIRGFGLPQFQFAAFVRPDHLEAMKRLIGTHTAATLSNCLLPNRNTTFEQPAPLPDRMRCATFSNRGQRREKRFPDYRAWCIAQRNNAKFSFV